MTKWQLFSLLTKDGRADIELYGVRGILQSVERESGNGRCFNLRILVLESGKEENIFIKTSD